MCTIWPCRKGGTPEPTKKKPKSINVSSQRYGSEKKFKGTLKFKVATISELFRILPPLLPPSKQGTSVQKDPLGGVIGRLALCASTTSFWKAKSEDVCTSEKQGMFCAYIPAERNIGEVSSQDTGFGGMLGRSSSFKFQRILAARNFTKILHIFHKHRVHCKKPCPFHGDTPSNNPLPVQKTSLRNLLLHYPIYMSPLRTFSPIQVTRPR